MVRTLTTDDFNLTLESDSNGWCEVYIRIGYKTIRLGADHEAIVVQRLMSAMDRNLNGPMVGAIQGINVVWILSLAEEHATIYAGDDAGYRILFFQDASGNPVGDVRLTHDDKRHWLSILAVRAE